MKISFYIIFVLVILISCSENKNLDDKNNSINLSKVVDNRDKIDSILKNLDTFPLIKYERFVVSNQKIRKELLKKYTFDTSNPALNKAMRTLNRKELGYIRVGDTILIPDKFYYDMRAYTIFPFYYKEAKDIPKIILVSNKWQSYACYEYGKLVRFAAANTGKEKTPSYPGRYALVWKAELRRSSLDSNWIMPYTWNFHRFAGSAFHKFDMPGYPASHSCIRQFLDDAKWLFKWGEGAKYDTNKVPIHLSGTPVIIIDHYDFSKGRKGDWLYLNSNKDLFLDLPKKPLDVEEALIPIFQIPKEVRGMLPNRNRYLYAEDTLRARGIIREGVKLTESINFNKLRRQKAEMKRKKDSLNKLQENQLINLQN